TFTEPEISRIGMTQKTAEKKYKKIKIYTNKYSATDRSITDNKNEGFIKVITDKKGLIIGASIIGDKASEIIQGLIVAKALKTKFSKLASILYIYPTLSELVKKTAAKPLIEKANNHLIKIFLNLLKN
ncbi:MAG: hypothetical protein PHV17_07525, partial [Candidatus Omnitrophica bacterium]|nr:hypothetical protein [Candidatus Omnitrophota bacterium]